MLENKFIKLFFILISLWACGEQNSKTVKKYSETELFNNLLVTLSDSTIPQQEHFYIMVPRFGCNGCMQKQLLNLCNNFNTNQSNKITFIVSNNNTNVVLAIDSTCNIIKDTMGIMDNYDLKLAGVKFIHTNEKLVKENTSFHHDSIKQVLNFLKLNS